MTVPTPHAIGTTRVLTVTTEGRTDHGISLLMMATIEEADTGAFHVVVMVTIEEADTGAFHPGIDGLT